MMSNSPAIARTRRIVPMTYGNGSPPTGRAQSFGDRHHVPAGHDRITAGEGRHLVAAAVELRDELEDDPFRAAIGDRWDRLERRRDLGDTERCGHTCGVPRDDHEFEAAIGRASIDGTL